MSTHTIVGQQSITKAFPFHLAHMFKPSEACCAKDFRVYACDAVGAKSAECPSQDGHDLDTLQ